MHCQLCGSLSPAHSRTSSPGRAQDLISALQPTCCVIITRALSASAQSNPSNIFPRSTLPSQRGFIPGCKHDLVNRMQGSRRACASRGPLRTRPTAPTATRPRSQSRRPPTHSCVAPCMLHPHHAKPAAAGRLCVDSQRTEVGPSQKHQGCRLVGWAVTAACLHPPAAPMSTGPDPRPPLPPLPMHAPRTPVQQQALPRVVREGVRGV